MGQTANQFERRVIIVGVGLIGGSIAAAHRKRFPDAEVIGVGRSSVRLQQAEDAGLVTGYATQYSAELFSGSCLVVVCLPVDMIAEAVLEISRISSTETVITDAGSVKAVICKAVGLDPNAVSRFVGAHPIAGGENGGFEFADPELFCGRVCVVTESQGVKPSAQALQRVSSFWSKIGCQVEVMSDVEHDRVLALTSHLPHVMAAATTSAVGSDNLSMCGSGFRDATRIAAGSPTLWKAILNGNRKQVVAAIIAAELHLVQFRQALESGDAQRLEELLAAAADCRSQLD